MSAAQASQKFKNIIFCYNNAASGITVNIKHVSDLRHKNNLVVG